MSDIYDVIVVGAGPAGLSAAIYLARAKLSVLVLEQKTIGGQITITSEVVNYPGVIFDSGKRLTEKMRDQALGFNAEFKITKVERLNLENDIKEVYTNHGVYRSLGVVLATGAKPRKLGFNNEEKYQGRGIAYCATCDGEFFTDKSVFVVGGGFAACEEALFLCKYASKITMIVREEDFTCARSISEKVLKHPKINVIFETEVESVAGDETLKKVVFRNNKTQAVWEYTSQERFGLFIFAGYVPNNSLFKDQIQLTEQGYIIADKYQQTNLAGVYAAGDICDKNLRQVVTAVSDGAISATSLERYLIELKSQKNITTRSISSIEKNEQASVNGQFIDAGMASQLQAIFAKLTKEVVIEVYHQDDEYSQELIAFMQEIAALSDKIILSYQPTNAKAYVRLSNNLHYHLIAGGHEINSLILAIYNLGSQGQVLTDEQMSVIRNLIRQNIQIFISLSCTMCPELVQAAQRIAIINPNIDVRIYDLAHYPEFKDKYNIMSVPCMVIDNETYFGKKDLNELLTILSNK